MALSKRKIDSVIDYLQSIKKECVVEVKQEVSESYHVKFFADRSEIFRLLCKESPDREPADDGGCSFEKIAQVMCFCFNNKFNSYNVVNYLAAKCSSIFSTRGKFCYDQHPRTLHTLSPSLYYALLVLQQVNLATMNEYRTLYH